MVGATFVGPGRQRAAAGRDHRDRRRGAAGAALACGPGVSDGERGVAAVPGGVRARGVGVKALPDVRAGAAGTRRAVLRRDRPAACGGCRGCAASCSGRSSPGRATGSRPAASGSGAPCSAAGSASKNGMHYFRGMPKWSFGRGGTTIGAIYLTHDNDSDDVMEHEAEHRAQWKRYGLAFISAVRRRGDGCDDEPVRGRRGARARRLRAQAATALEAPPSEPTRSR